MLKQFQDGLLEYCNEHLEPSPYMMKNGYPAMQAKWQSPTGRIYTFIQQAAPKFMMDRGIYGTISPQQIANYPMQGFATGDVVPEILGQLLYIPVISNPQSSMGAFPINTVHDSILFDATYKTVADLQTIGKQIKTCMEQAPDHMKKSFGIEMTLPFKVDLEYGPNWNEMKRLDLGV